MEYNRKNKGDYYLLPMGKDDSNLHDKNYNMGALVLAHDLGYVDKDEDDNVYRIIDETEFLSVLKDKMRLSAYKAKKVEEAFIEIGVIIKKDKELYLSSVESNFLRLFIPTAKYCIDNLSDYVFKLYCLLLNIDCKHRARHYKEYYCFSDKELNEKLGYTDNNAGRRLNEGLNTLETLGLIKYNHKYHYKNGAHGLYRELYWASDVTDVERQALNDIVDGGSATEEDIEDLKLYEGKMLEEAKYIDKKALPGEIDDFNSALGIEY